MSNGFYIMVWDGWSEGLNPILPQLLPIGGVDSFGYPRYWSSANLTDEEIIEKYNLEDGYFRIIR